MHCMAAAAAAAAAAAGTYSFNTKSY